MMAVFSGVLQVFTNVILPIFIIIAMGWFAARQFHPNPRTIATVSLYLFTPFLVFGAISKSALKADELLLIMGLALLLAFITTGIGYGTSRLLGYERKVQSAFMLVIVLLNAGNYGLPLNEFAYGAAGLERATVYYVTTSLIANTFGVFLASWGKASIKQSFSNIFKVPMVYALALGLLVNFTQTTVPLPIMRIVTLLGGAAVPTMLALLGIQLAQTSLKGRLGPIAIASTLRLVGAPLVMLGLVMLFSVEGVTRSILITDAAMPTAVITSTLAIQFDADKEFVTGTILVTTVASVVTLSVLLMLLGVRG